ncbi:uncharacterized protein LOC128296656 [Gossypium arboreum]|uniref:uncharacterized protein LOC128296656 n=1 Tax=Gossypium arboreum TaxID=29729 RepID=UPI0022F178D6|nr:uncharacterized protein LOC128296656 [Gossypium arboreum]
MCIRFEERLNDEIRMIIGGVEIQEFITLSNRDKKLEEVYNRKIQRDRRNRESFKRSSSKTISAALVKKFRDDFSQPTSTLERSGKSKITERNGGVTIKPVASVSSVQNSPKPRCKECGRFHSGECWGRTGACYRSGSTYHFIQDCPKLLKEEEEQKEKQMATPQKVKCSSQSSATATVCSRMSSAARLEAQAPTRTYAIRAREEAKAPDVIADNFYLFNDFVYALIDPGSTHSYICTALASEKKLCASYKPIRTKCVS